MASWTYICVKLDRTKCKFTNECTYSWGHLNKMEGLYPRQHPGCDFVWGSLWSWQRTQGTLCIVSYNCLWIYTDKKFNLKTKYNFKNNSEKYMRNWFSVWFGYATGILVPWQGLNLCPLQCRVLTTRPPGKSLPFLSLICLYFGYARSLLLQEGFL